MGKLVLDADLRAKLNGGDASVDLTDESGNVVGRYFTHARYRQLIDAIMPPP